MIEKFLFELDKELSDRNIEDTSLREYYLGLFNKYIRLGQSEFDIIRHFGEPSHIVDEFVRLGTLPATDMDGTIIDDFPSYLEEKAPESEPVTEELKKEDNNAKPISRTSLILNDVILITPGLIIATFGIIALAVVSVFMTATSIVQMFACWKLATTAAKWGGFFISLLVLGISILFYFIVAWLTKVVVKSMKKYAKEHKENWNKATK